MYSGRKQNIRRPRRNVWVFCEGESEQTYFKRYKSLNRGINIHIRVGPTSPKGLVKKAIRRANFSAEDGDELWCVFDCDENLNEQISEAVKLGREKSFNFAFSNPCFELWYLLHFENISTTLFKREVFDKLDNYLPGYEENRDYFDSLTSKRSRAIQRSERLEKKHLDDGVEILSRDSNPSTQIFKLVKRLM